MAGVSRVRAQVRYHAAVSNGAFYVTGLQTNLPGQGVIGLGPFAIPFTDIQQIIEMTLLMGVANDIVPPQTSGGLWIIPVGTTNVGPLVLGGADTDAGLNINPNGPTFLNWDQTFENSVYVLISAGQDMTVVLQST